MGRDIWGKWVHLMRTQFILRGVYPNSIAVSIVWSTFGRFDLGHMGGKRGGGATYGRKRALEWGKFSMVSMHKNGLPRFELSSGHMAKVVVRHLGRD